MNDEIFQIDWGVFSLVEFIVGHSDDIGERFRSCIDIGSGAGGQSDILRKAGLDVFQLDKYSDRAEYKVDFIGHDFDRQFDVVFCSHVIEHQRNVGRFLDKIHDVMADDGLLVISAPKHTAETMVEGHLNCFFTTYFVQQLVHAGFDLQRGKYLSCGGIENAAIVPKAANFDLAERLEDGYLWTEKHQSRSFITLQNQTINNVAAFFHNCVSIGSPDGKSINFTIPATYRKKGIRIDARRWGFQIDL